MMLTWSKPDGSWGLVNMELKDVPSWLYGHMMKLHHYEKTGLSPDQVEDMKVGLKERKANLDGIRPTMEDIGLAIGYFEDTIRESFEILDECTPALRKELWEQKRHLEVALGIMRAVQKILG